MLKWFYGATWDAKYDFFHTMFGVLPPSEVKTLANMANKMKRVSKRKLIATSTQPKKQRNEPVPVSEPVPLTEPVHSSSSEPKTDTKV